MVTWHETPVADLTIYAEDISWTIHEYTSAITLSEDNFLVLINTVGNITATLPKASNHPKRIYTIKNVGSGSVTIDTNGDDKIEWEKNLVLGLQGDIASIVSSGIKVNESHWFIIGGRNVKLEELLKEKLDAVVDVLDKVLIEAKQITLHQSSISEEDVGEEDVEG